MQTFQIVRVDEKNIDKLGFVLHTKSPHFENIHPVDRIEDPFACEPGYIYYLTGPLIDVRKGWIHVFISRRIESDPFAEIGGIVVAEPYRGSEIGRQLFSAAEKWATDQRLTNIRIRSRLIRKNSHAIFQHLGYAISKEQLVFDKDLSQENK